MRPRARRRKPDNAAAGVAGTVPPALPSVASRLCESAIQAQDRHRMTPFAVQQVWHAGRRVQVGERGSTLALLLEAAVQRITAAAMSPTGCPCCRCSIRIRRTADLQSVTVAVARSDDEEFRTLSRVYCGRCARDPATAAAMAGWEHGAIALRFRVRVPPSAVAKSALKQPAGAAAC